MDELDAGWKRKACPELARSMVEDCAVDRRDDGAAAGRLCPLDELLGDGSVAVEVELEHERNAGCSHILDRRARVHAQDHR